MHINRILKERQNGRDEGKVDIQGYYGMMAASLGWRNFDFRCQFGAASWAPSDTATFLLERAYRRHRAQAAKRER
jgi:hypothetical protein